MSRMILVVTIAVMLELHSSMTIVLAMVPVGNCVPVPDIDVPNVCFIAINYGVREFEAGGVLYVVLLILKLLLQIPSTHKKKPNLYLFWFSSCGRNSCIALVAWHFFDYNNNNVVRTEVNEVASISRIAEYCTLLNSLYLVSRMSKNGSMLLITSLYDLLGRGFTKGSCMLQTY